MFREIRKKKNEINIAMAKLFVRVQSAGRACRERR